MYQIIFLLIHHSKSYFLTLTN